MVRFTRRATRARALILLLALSCVAATWGCATTAGEQPQDPSAGTEQTAETDTATSTQPESAEQPSEAGIATPQQPEAQAELPSDENAQVTFSHPSGSYPQAKLDLEMSAPEGWDIYYTIDGSTPTESSIPYEGPVTLQDRTSQPSVLMTPENVALMTLEESTVNDEYPFPKANVIRAIAISEDGQASAEQDGTYFVGIDLAKLYPGIPMFSIVTDPANLLDYDTGILVRGSIYDDWVRTDEAESVLDARKWDRVEANVTQKGRDWERPAHFTLLVDGADSVSFPGGIRVKGGYSRGFLQRSFNVYLRDSYGQDELSYELIDAAADCNGATISQYRSFSLRNGGNDTMFLKFRDAMLQSLAMDRDFSTQASTPAIVFLNGEFMSIYGIQEKYSGDYFAQHYGVDPDEVIVMKDGELDEGEENDVALYDELLSYAERDLSDTATWEEFRRVVDIESMLDYFAYQIYVANDDWKLDSNFQLWRTRSVDPDNAYADGRWRFCLCDLDNSTALYKSHDMEQYDADSFQRAVETFPLFESALENPQFREAFSNRIREIGTKDLEYGRVSATLGEYAETWHPHMEQYRLRFGWYGNDWDDMVGNVDEFFAKRYDYIVGYVDAGLE